MARLTTRRLSAQWQEIPDSYESQQQELSLSSNDAETEDEGYDSQLIQQQLTQEKPEDEDDDDGTVNLFDIVDFVNKVAVPPSKRDAQANRLSLPNNPPSALPSSPRNQIETQESQAAQNTQSSTQSDEGHFANYMRRQKLAQQQRNQNWSPLRRPGTGAETLSRSATPVDLFSVGKPDPYDFPASPERELKHAPGPPLDTTKDAKKSEAGGKRKRKEIATWPVVREETRKEDLQPLVSKRQRRGHAMNAATAHRAETPEKSAITRRPRRGLDKPEYSPGSLRKENAGRRKKLQAKVQNQSVELSPKHRAVPRSARKSVDADTEGVAREEREHELEANLNEPAQMMEVKKTTPVVELPLKRTMSRKVELEAETAAASSAAQNEQLEDEMTYENSNAIIGSSPKHTVARRCASCYSKNSNQWHAQMWNDRANNKIYCDNCYVRDFEKKKNAEDEVERAFAKLPKTALNIHPSPPSTRAKARKDHAITQVLATQSELQRSQSLPLSESANTIMMRKEQQEDLPKVWAGSGAEIQVSSPIPETPKRSRRAKSVSVAPQSPSPRVLRKPRQHFKDTTLPVAPASASQLAEEPATEPSSPDAQAGERKKTDNPDGNVRSTRTTRQSRREKAQSQERASFEPPMNGRALRSSKVEVTKALRQTGQEQEQEQEESLFVSQDEEVMEVDMEIQVEGDREMQDIGEHPGNVQVVINDDDSPWEEDADDEAKSEAGDQEDDEDVHEEGGVSGITSILMAPSPKKVSSQNIAALHRPLKSKGQKPAAGQRRKVVTSQQSLSNLSPPLAYMEDEDEDMSLDSEREKPLAPDVPDNFYSTMEYGRNPFDEPTFEFTSSAFSATSKCFIKDMLLDPDVREIVKVAKEIRAIVADEDRKTKQAREIHKLRQFLVADYKAMRAQRNSDEHDEGVICDLYGNTYTNTRKLHNKVYGIIDNDLSSEPRDISNGEAAKRTKLRRTLLEEIYLFIAPDLLRIIRSIMATYCSKGPPGMLCFEEIQGVIRITRNLLRTAEDEANKPHRPKQLLGTGNDYHYPEYRKLIRTLEKVNKSCDMVLKEQAKYEQEKEMEDQHKTEAQNEKLRVQQLKDLLRREHEERRRAKAEEAAEEERIRAEKLRAWQKRNAPLLNQWKGKEVPRQFVKSVPPVSTPDSRYQAPSAKAQGMLAERIEELEIGVEDSLVHDIRAIQPIVNERSRPRQTRADDRPIELRRKPVVAASRRKMPWAQNGQMPQVIVKPHALPMSNDETDDEAFAPPQPQRQKRKFVHHPITSDEKADPVFNHDEAQLMSDDEPLIPLDLDSVEEKLPEHPIARRVPRARTEEDERSLTQRRLDEEQRLKLLKAEAEDIEKERLAKLAAIAEVERRKAELEIQEREYYATRDQAYGSVDLDLNELGEKADGEDEHEHEHEENEEFHLRKMKIEHVAIDEEDEDDNGEQGEEEDIYGVSSDGDDQSDEGSNNNKVKHSDKPWTHADLSELIAHLKFYEYENKYIEAAESLGRNLEDVIATANKHKEHWAEEYLEQGADVPPWVMDIGRM